MIIVFFFFFSASLEWQGRQIRLFEIHTAMVIPEYDEYILEWIDSVHCSGEQSCPLVTHQPSIVFPSSPLFKPYVSLSLSLPPSALLFHSLPPCIPPTKSISCCKVQWAPGRRLLLLKAVEVGRPPGLFNRHEVKDSVRPRPAAPLSLSSAGRINKRVRR